jgi:hypothetical protein
MQQYNRHLSTTKYGRMLMSEAQMQLYKAYQIAILDREYSEPKVAPNVRSVYPTDAQELINLKTNITK